MIFLKIKMHDKTHFKQLIIDLFSPPTGAGHGRERTVMRQGLLCGPPRDAVSAGGDGPERGGRPRPGEADLAPAAAGGHDHPAVPGVHRLPALREDSPAGG